jgi:pimeloyl-ACP methyl ester carboxylesterase
MVPVVDGQFATLPNGTRLHYSSAGDQDLPLLLFLHGFPEAGFAWDGQLARLGEGFFAVAPDLRGFNRSSKPSDVRAYHVKRIAEDVRQFIAYLGRRTAIVVCHDWGGAVGWHLGIFHPEIVERLIVINSPHPWVFMRDLAEDPAQQAASAYMDWLRRPEAEVALAADGFRVLERFLEDGLGRMPTWYTPAVRARYHAMWSTPGEPGPDGLPTHGMTGGCNYYRASPLGPPRAGDPARELPDPDDFAVEVPTRVIWGDDDRALLPGLVDGLALVCRDLEVQRVPGASHWIVHERPDEVAALIRSFVDD